MKVASDGLSLENMDILRGLLSRVFSETLLLINEIKGRRRDAWQLQSSERGGRGKLAANIRFQSRFRNTSSGRFTLDPISLGKDERQWESRKPVSIDTSGRFC